jgi:hypothetical protein
MRLPVSRLVKDLLHHQPEEVNVGIEVGESGHQACLEGDEVGVHVSQGEWHAQKVVWLYLKKCVTVKAA